MAKIFNPLTKKGFDETGQSQTETDARYVNTSGDTMTGELDMQDNAIILKSDNNKRWKVTIGDDGNLISTEIITINSGIPYGLLLTLTQP
jgi:hypothetical protein